MNSPRSPRDAWLAALTLPLMLGACSTDLPAPGATVSVQPPGVERVDLVGALDVTNATDATGDDTDDTSLDVESPEVDADLVADDVDDDGDARRDTAGDGEVDDGETDVADTVMPPTVDEGPHGFGADTTGGNGGMIYVVTSTLDAGPGSLREALAATGKREIHFDIDAPIVLATPILITSPGVTLDGATDLDTPVTLTGAQIRIQTTDVVMRHLRFRPQVCGQRALEIIDGSQRVLIDHCSFTWGGDEPVEIHADDPAQPITDLTVQWSIVADSLDCDGNTQGGFELYGFVARASVHHNLLGIAETLTPNLRPRGPVEFVDNFIYDPGARTQVGIQLNLPNPMTSSAVDFVGNVYVPGADTPTGVPLLEFSDDDTTTVSLYLADHLVDGDTTLSRLVAPADEIHLAAAPIVATSDVPRVKPTELEATLLPRVGAQLPCRDRIDTELIADIAARTAVIDMSRTPAEVTAGATCP